MQRSTPTSAALIDAAMGRVPIDILFTNARIVDVLARRLVEGSIGVFEGVIIGVAVEGSRPLWTRHPREVIDLGGHYVSPGLIDAHLHIESSNITPAQYARLAAGRGTTTAIADPHEVTNVGGVDALHYMVKDAARAPVDIRFMIPSCVPSLPDELAGGNVNSEDMAVLIDENIDDFFGIGEMMNMPGVIDADPETLARIELRHRLRSGVCDGHAPGLTTEEMDAYALAGISADHECNTADQALARISRGMYVMAREGTCSHDADAILPLVREDPRLANRVCLCTDDRSPSDAIDIGMVDNVVRRAVLLGIDPIDAISMATLTPAVLFGIDRPGEDPGIGSIAPGRRADLLVMENLDFDRPPLAVYHAGEKIAENGAASFELAEADSELCELEERMRGTVKLPELPHEIFDFPFDPSVPVIGILPHIVVTEKLTRESEEGLHRVVSIERHGRLAEAVEQGGALADLIGTFIGRGFVSGFGVDGAIASTQGHDSHNLLVIGDDADDMQLAASQIGSGGLVYVRDGEVIARYDLPIAGLMSDEPAEEMAEAHRVFSSTLTSAGVPEGVDPIMGLVFLSLPVIPEIRITPRGIIDLTRDNEELIR